MHRNFLALSANVFVAWLLSAGLAHSQTVGLVDTRDTAKSYDDVPVPELVYARFGNSPDPVVREQVAQGMFNTALNLSRSGEAAESTAAYSLV